MFRILFLALFVLALAVSSAVAQDATKVDSQHYKVESENSRVRVVRAKYGPHEKSVMHSHPDLVAIFQTDSRVKFTYPGGKTEEREMKAGQTLFTPAVTHLPENLSDSDMEVILVELKTPKRRPHPRKPPSTNTNINGN
jgi:quercetin dioxygenase-like cupin family protein